MITAGSLSVCLIVVPLRSSVPVCLVLPMSNPEEALDYLQVQVLPPRYDPQYQTASCYEAASDHSIDEEGIRLIFFVCRRTVRS